MAEYYAGLDVSMSTTYIWLEDYRGKKVKECEVKTSIEDISLALLDWQGGAQLVMESGPLSSWLCKGLRGVGFDTICADARHLAALLSSRTNKNDRNDSRGIAQMARAGLIREVEVKSDEAQEIQMLLGSRNHLVGAIRTMSNTIRGLLKAEGIRFSGPLSAKKLIEKTNETLAKLSHGMNASIQPLLRALEALSRELLELDKLARKKSSEDPRCRLLMTAPSVGPIVSLTYVSTIDRAERFEDARSVGAYLGCTPKQYASGEVDRHGRMSRCGPAECRYMLFEAAMVLLTACKKPSKLRTWGLKLAKKKGMRKACGAVARKLSVILHRMLITNTEFQYQGV